MLPRRPSRSPRRRLRPPPIGPRWRSRQRHLPRPSLHNLFFSLRQPLPPPPGGSSRTLGSTYGGPANPHGVSTSGVPVGGSMISTTPGGSLIAKSPISGFASLRGLTARDFAKTIADAGPRFVQSPTEILSLEVRPDLCLRIFFFS